MGAGKGPIIVLHENFQGIAKFAGFRESRSGGLSALSDAQKGYT